MNTIEKLNNIKLDVETEGTEPSTEVLSKVRLELKKLMHLYGNIVGVNVYLKQVPQQEKNAKWVRWRVGIPGRDIFAEASSSTWVSAISQASDQISVQLLNRYR
ncbi:hypothetical protein GCM10027275_48930 [Rhabdobacter roseus]|uniref:Ribosome-associated translation inhibitor RaiA n=1 Tax=Rhabdobacter roseus TaxID=1655419 RepID=A0A840TZJ9_9BACT|nr:HPF/RaiA family ribosome-associated protein [Rhabdobacter roseus]MBB5286957.1 ribosome-associated translation inhibitor RaiA [Rhabdobacter roseus]